MTLGTVIGRNPDNPLRQEWRTPLEVYVKLDSIFHFTVDACADAENALCHVYWTKYDNALAQDWTTHTVFCNPPFSMLSPIAEKCMTAKLAVLLAPLTALCTKYMSKTLPRWLLLPDHRMKFTPPPGLQTKKGTPSPSLGTVVMIYGEATEAQVMEVGYAVYAATGK